MTSRSGRSEAQPPGAGHGALHHPETDFPHAAAAALADSQLRANLAHATATIRDKRAAMVGEHPSWSGLRAAGAGIKDDVLARLDTHLTELERRLQDAGATVHWAVDAADANRIVTDVVTATGAREVVKVKSMTTQEIELNEALAEAGIAAWETDLAELIVQLGDDAPSHILVPAIHRNRAEVREIFLDRMAAVGVAAPADLTDAPAELAAAARAHLREKFLTARVAVSGANFAVAETGTLSVVESEGNGRMCLTLPETLVTVVGIEKVVPTWRDLEVFLQTLPRSSTGERMNPYTSFWNGVHPGDGPQDVHVVLLDNGRTDVLADQVGRQALRCIRCSACLNVCPVYERTGGHTYGSVYPGPIGAVLTPQLRGTDSPLDKSLPFASSLCGACEEVCPVAIEIPDLLVHLRTRVADQAPRFDPQKAVFRALKTVMATGDRLAAAERGTGLARRILSRSGRVAGIPMLPSWTTTRDVPDLPEQSFRAWWEQRERVGDAGAAIDGDDSAVEDDS